MTLYLTYVKSHFTNVNVLFLQRVLTWIFCTIKQILVEVFNFEGFLCSGIKDATCMRTNPRNSYMNAL